MPPAHFRQPFGKLEASVGTSVPPAGFYEYMVKFSKFSALQVNELYICMRAPTRFVTQRCRMSVKSPGMHEMRARQGVGLLRNFSIFTSAREVSCRTRAAQRKASQAGGAIARQDLALRACGMHKLGGR